MSEVKGQEIVRKLAACVVSLKCAAKWDVLVVMSLQEIAVAVGEMDQELREVRAQLEREERVLRLLGRAAADALVTMRVLAKVRGRKSRTVHARELAMVETWIANYGKALQWLMELAHAFHRIADAMSDKLTVEGDLHGLGMP